MSGKNLKVARVKRGLTQRQLAALSGVGLTSITKIEKYGIEATTVSTLRKLAEALELTVEDLFFSEEE
ncbi:helix-turn-helix transcriptional regulator [Romboutsia timonensis]|uniref:helix-turn-helix transcriptional regulator n=1 Tax=Romboutsia timonensis TaxID=1776391 RepID=UPI002A747956|nr:helix-turn-helix transcriptional regulator [Romboutsia timonensis]MDY3001911.1 helix-turn-helix transcriptional regulator [Romboutsia timonensis]MDY3960716.1 helix-turn-helix transcriptional regulator [Romboutsia timonensis]